MLQLCWGVGSWGGGRDREREMGLGHGRAPGSGRKREVMKACYSLRGASGEERCGEGKR